MEKEFDRKREAERRGRKRGGKTRTGRETLSERERERGSFEKKCEGEESESSWFIE